MKFIFVDIFNPIPINSGGDWYKYYLLNQLSEEHEVHGFYTYNEPNKKGFSPIKLNFTLKLVPKKIKWSNFFSIFNILRPEYLFLEPNIKSDSIDAIFTNIYCYHIALKISKKKIPIILIMHNVEWKYFKDNGSLIWIFLFLYESYITKKQKYIITISPTDYAYVKKIAKKSHIFYFPPHIDNNQFNEYGDSFEYGKDKFNILFYGSMNRPQNIIGLKFILRKLIPFFIKKDLMKKIRINIIGSGYPPKELNIENNLNINYLGLVEDLGFYIRGADIIIVPLKNSAGMKIRLLESFACGKTIIASSEAIAGIPKELKKFFLTANTPQEYYDIIIERIDKKETKININQIKKYLNGDDFSFLYDKLGEGN